MSTIRLTAVTAWILFASIVQADQKAFHSRFVPFLKKYCVECHNARKAKADIDLTIFATPESLTKHREPLELTLELLDIREMPPKKELQPTEHELDFMIKGIRQALSNVDCSSGKVYPGTVTIRRLNRNEYNNTIRDLVGVDFQPAHDFPSDDVGYGFDHIGDVLTISPILMEKYLAAAESIMDRAIAVPQHRKSFSFAGTDFKGYGGPSGGALVFSSSGEAFKTVNIGADGEFEVVIRAFASQAGDEVAKLEFKVDGQIVKTIDIPNVRSKPGTFRHVMKLKQGSRRLSIKFANDFYDPDNPDRSRRDRNLYLEHVSLDSLFRPALTDLPSSHVQLFGYQSEVPRKHTQEDARRIVNRLASFAFRRRATDAEVDKYTNLIQLAVKSGDSFEQGVKLAGTAILVSPHFLFRYESEPTQGKPYRELNDFELATRLSYFLWSSMPDPELFGLAAGNALRKPDVLQRQVARMLQDPKSQAFIRNFFGQWLTLRDLPSVSPDPKLFPTFTPELRTAMTRETELFIQTLIREDRSVLDLLTADFTFVNERLAKHYGISSIKGEDFQRVSLDGTDRTGLLTHASILTLTSNPTRTSPVKRGKWMMDNILGTPARDPPPNVELLSEEKEAILSGSLRQRLERHRDTPTCAACHETMDTLGFAFENFDAVGRFRDQDGKFPVEPDGTLPGGDSFDGPKELASMLRETKQRLIFRGMAKKMLTYALGRGLTYYDECTIDDIVTNIQRSPGGPTFTNLINQVVQSAPFQLRGSSGEDQ